ncbi:LysR family transcriptional regulator [Neptuniibacter halophilus]|uniref:LysR family transcriptional regulator n=1 Tax=Neptuniibacter halophilus TaxID=651666 RepID=UPI002572C2AD|nr:LysR family transcriptional regulator [Neptuniibacter halophilus]
MGNFDDISLFNKVAEYCSYTRAARQLDLPIATLSRRVKLLEQRLGVQLINRDTRKLSLTEAGTYLYQASRGPLSQLREIERETSNYQIRPAGELKLTIPVEISVRLLNEILSDFALLHPQINLLLNVTNEVVDIIHEGYDLAIRGGAPKDSNLISRKIMSSRLHLCCSAEYLAEHSPVHTPQDLEQHCLMTYNYEFYTNPKLVRGEEEVVLSSGSRLSANSFDMLHKCALKGMGIAVMPSSVCYESLRSGALVSLLSEWQMPEVALYALYPNRVKTKKLQLLIDYLEQRLQQVEQAFAGIQ